MILLLDAGNTRLKWAWLAEGPARHTVHASPHHDLTAQEQACRITPPRRVLGASVTSSERNAAIMAAVGRPVEWLVPAASCAGVTNAYRDPDRLGADRWAQMIGAHHEQPGDQVLVSAGTALTIDCLDREGRFWGGTIAPGLGLLRHSLAEGTARLGLPDGNWQEYPDNSADAIFSGCLNALTAPIEAQVARFGSQLGRPVRLTLAGGDASLLAQHLAIDGTIVDNLVLSGLAHLARMSC